MFLPSVNDDNNSQAAITTWLGYNHNRSINSGEFYDMENMSSDDYPLLSPRKTRPLLVSTAAEYDARVDAIRSTHTVTDADAQPTSPADDDYWNDTANDILYHYTNSVWVKTDHKNIIRGLLLTDNKVAYLADDTLHFNEHSYDLSSYVSETGLKTEQQLLRFGAYILVFPEGVYINVTDTTDIGKIAESYSAAAGVTITYQITDVDGAGLQNIVSSDTAPTSPANGDYWLDTANNGLNIWYSSKGMWTAVATSYIKISVPGATFKSIFNVGDTVTLNSAISDINSGSVIQAMGDDYLLVIGIMNGVTKTEATDNLWTLTISRKLPKLDYVCIDDNRVWGCYYGDDGNGGVINEIYACKLGDFKNWYTYQGVSTDSYAISLGTDGDWTGCISYGGYPTFFKENAVMRIFGSTPSAYQLSITNCRGVQKGSNRSLAVVREYLVYKSPQDIVVYDGSTPTGISDAFGRDCQYYDAVGGGCLDKYYVTLQDTLGHYNFFIYDMAHGIWEKESSVKAVWFTTAENGQAYAASSDEIFGVGTNENSIYLNSLVGEEYVSWFAESGDMGLDAIGYKTISRLIVRASIPVGTNVELQISYDDAPYQTMQNITGSGALRLYSIAIPAVRCDHYRIKFVGNGDVKIYALAISLEEGSTENGEYSV